MSINKDILPPPTFLSYSLGCRTNQAEIENISLQLSAYGFTPYSPPCTSAPLHLCTYPTIVMLNTCVVTQKAEKETRQKIRELRKKFPDSFLVVLGCAATAKEKFKIDLPNTDLSIINNEKPKTVNLIIEQFRAKLCDSINVRDNFLLDKYQLSGRKFIKIQEGCDRFCSFCLTAYLRGKPQSVPPEKIIEEINLWVQKGIKEIILTGTNIGLYKYCHSHESGNLHKFKVRCKVTIVNLLKKILSETKVERLSFSSIDPEMLTDDFLKIIVNNPRITQCFHLSLQSGSSTALERMNRKTNLDKLLKKLKEIKKQNPFFTFRADIIVGFPEETEEEFKETIDFIKKAKISFVHSFLFSFRPGTKLEGMIKSEKWHEIPLPIKKQRAEILKKAVEEIRNNEAMKQLNNVTNCLIVRSLSRYIVEGITENGWPIVIKKQRSKDAKTQRLKGKIVPVKIFDYKNGQLFGEILSLPT